MQRLKYANTLPQLINKRSLYGATRSHCLDQLCPVWNPKARISRKSGGLDAILSPRAMSYCRFFAPHTWDTKTEKHCSSTRRSRPVCECYSMPSHTSLDEFDTKSGWRAPKASNVTMLIDLSRRSSLFYLAKGRNSVNNLLIDHQLRAEISPSLPTTCLSNDIIRRGGCRL